MKIADVIGREIYDSRGWPTLQCELILENGKKVYANVPAGLSRGKYEARELRDGGKRLWGKGVLKAIENLECLIGPELIGKEPSAVELDLKIIEMDGTQDKSHLGANTMLAASMALYRAQAEVEEIELFELIASVYGNQTISLPFPFFNVINGGMHANNNLNVQEFMIVPIGTADFRSSIDLGALFFHELKNVLQKHGKSTAVGDEGGFAPRFSSTAEALDILVETLEKIETEESYRCIIALDVAASRLFDPRSRKYLWQGELLTAQELVSVYENLVDSYPIYSIEDGLDEDDWEGWQFMMQVFEGKIQIVGDDLFATNIDRIARGIVDEVVNGVIIKPNQIGTITESLQAIRLCKNNNLNVIVSHRSGETEDAFIADLAVGSSAGQIKAGGLCRSERLAKYNRLLTIEDTLTAHVTASSEK